MAGAWARLVERARAPFEKRDPFADVTLAPRDTAPDPVPALPAPVDEPEQPAQEPLTPVEAHWALHEQHPDLPRDRVRWRFFDGAVGGEVDVLAVGEVGQRSIVARYAEVLGSEVTERPDGMHVVVGTAGEFANVTFAVMAVILHDDTMPLPAYREVASAQDTQQIPEAVLAEVVGAR